MAAGVRRAGVAGIGGIREGVDAQAGVGFYFFANENMIIIHICLFKCLISHAGMTLDLSKQVSRKRMPVLGIAGEYLSYSLLWNRRPHERYPCAPPVFMAS